MCQAWWGTLGVYSQHQCDPEYLAWVLEGSADDSLPVPFSYSTMTIIPTP